MNSGGTLLRSHPGVGCGLEPPMVSGRETQPSILCSGEGGFFSEAEETWSFCRQGGRTRETRKIPEGRLTEREERQDRRESKARREDQH